MPKVRPQFRPSCSLTIPVLKWTHHNAGLANPDGPRSLLDLFVERAFALFGIKYDQQRGAFEAVPARVEKARKFISNETFCVLCGKILLQAGRPAAVEKEFQTALAARGKLPPGRRVLPQTRELEGRLRAGLRPATLPSSTSAILTHAK